MSFSYCKFQQQIDLPPYVVMCQHPTTGVINLHCMEDAGQKVCSVLSRNQHHQREHWLGMQTQKMSIFLIVYVFLIFQFYGTPAAFSFLPDF